MADNDEDTVMDSGNHDGLDDEREPDLTLCTFVLLVSRAARHLYCLVRFR